MVLEAEQPTIQSAIDRDTRFDEWWREDQLDPNDARTAVVESMALARDEIRAAAQTYDLPFGPEDVTVVVVDELHGANASITPIDCGVYRSDWGEWTVEEQPSHYVMWVALDMDWRSEAAKRKTVRHELAHAADWHENLKTTEGTDTHKEWLRRLEAEQ